MCNKKKIIEIDCITFKLESKDSVNSCFNLIINLNLKPPFKLFD